MAKQLHTTKETVADFCILHKVVSSMKKTHTYISKKTVIKSFIQIHIFKLSCTFADIL